MTKEQTKLNAWLTSLLKREGKKSQIKRGDAKELIGLIADDLAADDSAVGQEYKGRYALLVRLGNSRARKRSAKQAPAKSGKKAGKA